MKKALNFAVQKIKTKYFLQISPDIDFDCKDILIYLDLAKKLDISKSDIDYTSVYTSSYLGAKYISIKYPETKKVRVVGMESIVSELESLGI